MIHSGFAQGNFMKTELQNKPRCFEVKGFQIKDFGKIFLEDGEMVSFVTPDGNECDFAAKSWGFYLGPSLNSRLKREGFKTALVYNEQGQVYVMAVETSKMQEFQKYLQTNQDNRVLCWLDEFLPSFSNPGDSE